MNNRKLLLEIIIDLEEPSLLPRLQEELRLSGWDSPEGELTNLTQKHIVSILQRYLNGLLSEKQVEDWANLVETREDITFGLHKDENSVMDAIHLLANPAMEGALTPESAKSLINKLKP
jgi:hypothetical protein